MANLQERYLNPFADFGFKKLFGEVSAELSVRCKGYALTEVFRARWAEGRRLWRRVRQHQAQAKPGAHRPRRLWRRGSAPKTALLAP